jgi:hypothetical protein
VLQVVQDYDLTRVRNRLLKEGWMPDTWIDEAIFEFRRYLGLRVLTGHSIEMFSVHVDEVWHTCLLFSRLYTDMCLEVFGYYLHHEPAPDPEPPGRTIRDPWALWLEFEEAYVGAYGGLTRFWLLARDRAALIRDQRT